MDSAAIPEHTRMTDSFRAASRPSLLIPAVVLGLGIVLAALVFGLFFQTARARVDTIQVTGAATQGFTSDLAKWRVTLTRQVPDAQTATGYRQLREDVEAFSGRLEAAGVARNDISIQPVNAQPYWGREGVREGYNLNQSLYVLSRSPEVLEELARDPGTLLGAGSVLESSMLEYYYTGIDSLKHSLLAAATRDARARAVEIAGADDGVSLGNLQSARAGVFQITEPFSTETSGLGMFSTSTRDKEITVTVHAVFRVD